MKISTLHFILVVLAAVLCNPPFCDAKKKNELSTNDCVLLDQRPGHENDSPCLCKIGGKKYRCETCAADAECEELIDLSPFGPAGRAVIAVLDDGIAVFDPRKQALTDLNEFGQKLFKVDSYLNPINQKTIPILVEVREADLKAPEPKGWQFSNIALIVSSLIVALGLYFGIKKRNA